MRIAGGEFKGRILKVPKTANIRPSTERIREAIFSVLGDDIVDAYIADLFCGSGALGLEALSRGADKALFIDSHHASIAAVRENAKTLGLESRVKIVTMNAMSIRPNHLDNINIIFADPPYYKDYCSRLQALLSLQKFNWYGILVLEHESDWRYVGDNYKMAKRIDFGDSAVTFLLKLKPESIEENKD